MKVFWIIGVFILLLIYIISPIDGVPDVIPFIGWLDDTFLLGLFIYYLRYGRLPGFMSWISRLLFKRGGGGQPRSSETFEREAKSNGQAVKATSAPKDPYEILELKPGASKEMIHTAYREAVQKYHPDKVSHLGKELQELASEKFVEIQDAYDFLIGKKP